MLGMEIKLNKERIAEKESYSYEVYIATLDKLFKDYNFILYEEGEARRYLGQNVSEDFVNLTIIYARLMKTKWFIQNLNYWYLLNSEDKQDPYDFDYEDYIPRLAKYNRLFWLDPQNIKPKKGIIAI